MNILTHPAIIRERSKLRGIRPSEIKSIPHTPTSHPFVERLIGTIRREYLDHILFWHAHDLERELEAFRQYYNQNRVLQSLTGETPAVVDGASQTQHADLGNYSWLPHCNSLYQAPIAA
jgi:putative transposase